MPKGSQLYDDSPRGKPRLSTLGYGTRKRAKNSIKQLKKMPRQYQLQAGTTTGYRDWETDRKSTRLNSSHRL